MQGEHIVIPLNRDTMELEHIYEQPEQYVHIEESIIIDCRGMNEPSRQIIIGNNVVCVPFMVYILPIKICGPYYVYNYMSHMITLDDIVEHQHHPYNAWTILSGKRYHGGETFVMGDHPEGFDVNEILSPN